jgi:hypothetical protein
MKIGQKGLSTAAIVGIVVIIVVVVVVAAVLLPKLGAPTTPEGTITTALGMTTTTTTTSPTTTTTTTTSPTTTTTTVTSLTCMVDATVENENMSGTMTVKAKDIGIGNKLKLREEGTFQTMGTTENLIMIVNGELQKIWAYENGQWIDLSADLVYWNSTVTGFQELMGYLSGWTGGDITYTENGMTVRIYNIVLNPVLEDSLFVYTGTATTLPQPTPPLTTSITIGGATAGSTTLTITHAGGDPIRTAFYENTDNRITADNWANMEVRINGAKVATASGATLDNLLLTPPSSHDFSVGDILVLPLTTPLSSGDTINVIYTPAAQTLASVTVP